MKLSAGLADLCSLDNVPGCLGMAVPVRTYMLVFDSLNSAYTGRFDIP